MLFLPGAPVHGNKGILRKVTLFGGLRRPAQRTESLLTAGRSSRGSSWSGRWQSHRYYSYEVGQFDLEPAISAFTTTF